MHTRRLCAIAATVVLCASPLVRADTLYSGSNNSRLVIIDTATGAGFSKTLNFVPGPSGPGVFAGAFSPDGIFYTVLGTYQMTTSLATVNLTTGAATPVAPLTCPACGGFDPSHGIDMLQFSASGTLYASEGSTLYQVDVNTAVLTRIGSFGNTPGGMMDLAMDSHGALYGVASGFLNPPSGPSMPESGFYAIDTTTGHATFLFSVSIPSIMGIAFDSEDHLLATSFVAPPPTGSPLYQIDLVTHTAVVRFEGTGVPNLHGGDIMRTPVYADLAAANAQISTLTGQLADANAQVADLTQQLADANAQITNLTQQLADANAQVNALTADMNEIARIVALPAGQRRNQPNRGVTPLGRAIIDALRPGL